MTIKSRILVVASEYPAPDRASGDVRFFSLLRMLSEAYEVSFCAIAQSRQVERLGVPDVQRYESDLKQLGVKVLQPGVARVLRVGSFDAVLFEFHYVARNFIEEVRIQQPGARIIVASVDVAFHRLLSKAKVTGNKADHDHALREKASELAVYRSADVVVTVTQEDANILLKEDPSLSTWVIPNIHTLHEPVKLTLENANRLVFVGSFIHEPNVDAIRYFCSDVLPLIAEAVSEVHMRIIGNAPPPEIVRLASGRVEVLGYVPETKPFLETSAVSIAPLRFGAGMKGKIGEAMSFGLPVVTTTVGVEGFGLTPGKDVLVGDTPEAFAQAVVSLLRDKALWAKVGASGFEFIRDNYSEPIVRRAVYRLFDGVCAYPVKRIKTLHLLRRKLAELVERHLSWRMK
ncbi:MAG: glycosyltransferase [Thiobacillus sp.]|nr:glycosyltransferase [Thiobacillus sp.]